MPFAPGTRLGSFEISARIGAGGMGEVYRATDLELKRQVAIKVRQPSLAVDPSGHTVDRRAELARRVALSHYYSATRAHQHVQRHMAVGHVLTLLLMAASQRWRRPPLSADALEPRGSGLHRPECVVTDADGNVYVPDSRGGVTRIAPDGSQQTWLAASPQARPPAELLPNGIALLPDGSFLMANLGETGGVWQLHRDGRVVPYLTEVDGATLPPANFVFADGDRTWISVSTRHAPRQTAWRPDVADGFVVLVDRRGPRVVADGLHYTNEVRPDPTGTWLYAIETFGRRISRFRIGANGSLSTRETIVTLGYGDFPDGFAFDRSGRIWLTSLISNRLLRVGNDGVETVLADENQAYIALVERAFAAGDMRGEHLGRIPGTRLQQLTSVAFGSDPEEVYLGSLHGDCVYRLRIDA